MRKRGAALLFAAALLLSGCGARKPEQPAPAAERQPYGVFLSVTEDLERLDGYETVVIDAQYFSREEIADFREHGHVVYTYLNVGALESFRPYFAAYADLTIGNYEHWDEELWIDVGDGRWQSFLLGELVPELLEKEVDGFFVDNCDVYYEYPTPEILEGLGAILRGLTDTGKKVLLNGGDAFLDAYCEAGGSWSEVVTGINQETVFSSIRWETEDFGEADAEDTAYFRSYVERYAAQGAEIFLLEYTTDAALVERIADYCRAHGFQYYISGSVELEYRETED